jgi:guanidinopropionase
MMSDEVSKGELAVEEEYNQMLAPRYEGIATFMRTPLVLDPSKLDIAIVGVPFDGAASNRAGARHGPREIRNMSSLMRTIHHVNKVNPYKLCRVGDMGDVPKTHSYHLETSRVAIMEFFRKVHNAGTVPLSAGGDHSITLPILRAIAADQPVGLIQIDAHVDTCDDYKGNRFSHGTQFRRAVEEEILDPKRTIQIGIRGAINSEDCLNYSLDSGMRVVFMEEFTKMGVEKIIAETRRVVGDGPTYVSFDVDGLDPVFAPGTGTPEIGGITTIEAQMLLRGLSGLDLVGGDVVEVAPPFDPSGITSLTAATMMFEILCVFAEAVVRRRGQ